MFIDTNVFVTARRALVRILGGGEPLRISRQVMREYLSVMTRPQTWSNPLPIPEALNDVFWLTATFRVLEGGGRMSRAAAPAAG